MPEIAKHIEVTKLPDGSGCKLTIDGEEFPWYCAADGISTEVKRDGIPTLTLTLLADRVTVDQSLTTAFADGSGQHHPAHSLEGFIERTEDRLAEIEADPKYGRLARAEAARGQPAKALEGAHSTIEKLHRELAEARKALEASSRTISGLAEDLSEAQHRARQAEAAPSPPVCEHYTVDQEDTESAGQKIGTAYVDVRPDLSTFEAEVKQKLQQLARDVLDALRDL